MNHGRSTASRRHHSRASHCALLGAGAEPCARHLDYIFADVGINRGHIVQQLHRAADRRHRRRRIQVDVDHRVSLQVNLLASMFSHVIRCTPIGKGLGRFGGEGMLVQFQPWVTTSHQ